MTLGSDDAEVPSAHFHIDVLEQSQYLDDQEYGLGDDLIAEVDAALDRIQQNPAAWQVLYANIRRHYLTRFDKYSVRYEYNETTQTIWIVGLFHSARHPDIGRQRR